MGRKIKDISGQRFGKLICIKFTKTENHRTYFLFRCDCGVEKEINKNLVVAGHIKSCGCSRTNWRDEEYLQLIGQKFNNLTVIELLPKKYKKNRWSR